MSVIIDINNKEVLKVQNSIFALLHETVISLIDAQKINISCELLELLDDTDQYVYGPGAVSADLEKYLKRKSDALLFARLIKEATVLEYNNFNKFVGCIDHLRNFHSEIIKYAEQLKQ